MPQVPNVSFEEGLQDSSIFDPATKNLVVIDHLMAETDDRVMTLFTKKSHHANMSVMYLVQKLFPKKRKSHHQSERAIHVDFEEPSRYVTDNAPSQADVSRSSESLTRVVQR